MSCVEPQTVAKVVHDRRTCFLCQDGDPNCLQYTAGFLYRKCSLVIREDKLGPVSPLLSLEKQCDLIVGVVQCELDATEVDEATAATTRLAVYTDHVDLDPDLICWPEGTPEEAIIAFTENSKCLRFKKRFECSNVPDEFKHLIQTKEVKSESEVKTVTRAPALETETKTTQAAAELTRSAQTGSKK